MNDNFEQNSLNSVQTPKLCYTAGGILIHKGKVLLVKHKKLGIWLNPGGHIDEDELPHEAAEREFFEETGIRVKAFDFNENKGDTSGKHNKVAFPHDTKLGFQPNPITTNLHWVNEESYRLRLKSENPEKRFPTKTWKRGCEQHVGFFYLLKPVGSVEFSQNEEETDGIAWFGLDEIDALETHENVRHEIKLGFSLLGVES